MRTMISRLFLVPMLLVFAACSRTVAPPSPTAEPIPATRVPPTGTFTPTTLPPPDTPVPSTASPTSTAAADPTLTPTATPVPDIVTRTPDAVELQTYLDQVFGPAAGVIEEILLDDLNGDREDDLVVVSDAAPVYILLWQGDHFQAPVVTGEWRDGLNNADGRFLYLKDYTDDGLPEVVNDSWALRGDDEYVAVDWERQITSCSELACTVIWQDWIQTYGNAPISTGMFYYSSYDYVYRNNNQLYLERRYTGLTFYWPYIGGDREPTLHTELNAVPFGWDTDQRLYIDVDIIKRFVWDGSRYVFDQDQVLREPELVNENMVLELEAPNGQMLTVDYERDTTLLRRGNTYRNDRCQLYLGNQAIGDPFACKYNFTRLEWQNVVQGLGQQLVVTTFAGDQSYIWPDLLVEKACFHERVQVYEWDDDVLTELANFVGCVRGTDLNGVRIEDIDEDGVLEIIAAPPWPQFVKREQPNGISQDYLQVNLLDEVYEWDGELFVIEWALEN